MKNPFWKQLTDAALQVIELLSTLVGQILSAPFKAIGRMGSNPRDLETYDSGGRHSIPANASFWQRILYILVEAARFVFKLFVGLLSFPFRFIRHLWFNPRRDLLWCLPAILAVFLLIFVWYRVGARQGSILGKYRTGSRQAMLDGDFELAKTFSQRVVSWPGNDRDADRLDWAVCLLRTNGADLGLQLIDELAPDDQVGYGPAHRIKAIIISEQLGRTRAPELREPLRWHLTNSNDQVSEQIQKTWALYYLETDQLDQAVTYLRDLAERNPDLAMILADIHRRRGDEASRRATLRLAEAQFLRLLESNPVSHTTRIKLAIAMAEQEIPAKTQKAEEILLRGLALKDDAEIRRAVADFMLMRHDKSADLDEQLALIQRALNYDLNYLETYKRLIQQFKHSAETNPEASNQVEATLMSSIATGQSTALAHFAISNLYSIKGQPEEAKWHLEKAYQLDPRFTVVANNLAWMLINEENPDLDRAYQLITEVVKRVPEDPRMRDTLGTVLMKQEKWDEALVQFEMILGTIRQPIPVHEKLAVIYAKLDKPKMAEEHRKRAADLKNAANQKQQQE